MEATLLTEKNSDIIVYDFSRSSNFYSDARLDFPQFFKTNLAFQSPLILKSLQIYKEYFEITLIQKKDMIYSHLTN